MRLLLALALIIPSPLVGEAAAVQAAGGGVIEEASSTSPPPGPRRGAVLPHEGGGSKQIRYVMGTLWTVEAEGPPSAVTAAFEEIKRLDRLLSTYKPDSELSRINREAAERWVPASSETLALIQRALDHAAASGGAFDPTVGPVVALWGFKHLDYRMPDPAAIRKALTVVGYRHVRLDPARGVRFDRLGLSLDLGAIGKGYAVDRAIATLRSAGCTAGRVDAGGNQAAFGRPVPIGIKHPRDEEALLGAIRLDEQAVATSGDAERGFWHEGVRYGHLIDPRTGHPAQGLLSVTVTAPSAETADALSTALYILGSERGLRHLGRYPGAEALFVEAGAKPGLDRTRASAGFR